MMLKKFLLFVSFLLVFGAISERDAYPQTDKQLMRSTLINLLSGFEHTPSKSAWQKIEGDIPTLLIEIYQDKSVLPLVRQRALGVLSYFPTSGVYAFYISVLHDPETSVTFRRVCLKAMGAGFGEKALFDIKPFLQDEDANIREAAVIGLGFISTVQTRDMLESLLGQEETIMVRQTIERVLKSTKEKIENPSK